MAKIMLADDEPSMQNLIRRIVQGGGYGFCCAADGEEAIDVYQREQPDLVILDVMMPKLDGFQVCQELRGRGAIVPIVFLTAKGDIADKGTGFNVGGDDYLVKPFDPDELLLRIDAHLKRNERIMPKQQEDCVMLGDLEFDTKRYRVTIEGKRIDFTPKEFQILFLLASHPGEAFTREQLIEAVWGEEFVGETSSLPVFIRKIREKIEKDPSHPEYLQTAWRSGYRFGG
ncbi:response regulator transcription factor [Raoultibacter massiliensis]|uniref:Response regulator transcription factor n=1 Tax=Raoultibacter massiliensis TaxID=1852371 RepID=A0ABV1JF67_9ACTN